MTDDALHALNRSKIALLTTYKRDDTAVSVVVDGDVAYFRTYSYTEKAVRLRQYPTVLAAPATFRGKPLGPVNCCAAQLQHGSAAAQASRKISRHSPFWEGLVIPLTAAAKFHDAPLRGDRVADPIAQPPRVDTMGDVALETLAKFSDQSDESVAPSGCPARSDCPASSGHRLSTRCRRHRVRGPAGAGRC